jgi:hypothetical protein
MNSLDEKEFYSVFNYQIINKIITNPITIINIIVWKPAKYAFWYLINKLF